MSRRFQNITSRLRMCMLAVLVVISVFSSSAVPLAAVHADNGTAICTAQSVAGSNIGTCINRIYVIALAAGGVIAVLLFVIAGYQYMSGGDGPKKAKGFIVSGVTGLIILFSAYLFLNTINPDLTSFTGASLPDLTCTGAGPNAGKNICAAPSATFDTGTSGSSGTGTAASASQVTITGEVSSDDNVQLTGTISGSPSGTFTWTWKSNGTVLTDAAGNPATTASIDTTMDSNTAGSHTDAVTATATSSTGTSYTGSATFNIVFDSDGDATSVTPIASATTASGNGLASPASQAEAKILLTDNSAGTIKLLNTASDCPNNFPLREVTDISNGNTTQSDGPGSSCAVGTTDLSVVMLTALHNLASSSSTQGTRVTALANGHHANANDPHYKGTAADLQPASASTEAAVIQSLRSSGATLIAIECNVSGTHIYHVLSASATSDSTCPWSAPGTTGYHIHVQF